MNAVAISYQLEGRDGRVVKPCFRSTILKLTDLHEIISLDELKFALRHCGIASGKSFMEIDGLDFSEGKVESVALHAINICSAVKRFAENGSKAEIPFSESNARVIFERRDGRNFALLERHRRVLFEAEFDLGSLEKTSQDYLCQAMNETRQFCDDGFFSEFVLPLVDELVATI